MQPGGWYEVLLIHLPWLGFRRVGRGSKLVGSGSAVPKKLISNEELSKFVDTSDEWISVRTGIRNRRVLGGEKSFS